jgi:hypothetical protein
MTADPHSDSHAFARGILVHARSELLDDFSNLETAVLKCERKFCAVPPPRGMPLSQRLAGLGALKPTRELPTADVQKLQKLARECEALLQLRATVVHSALKTVARNDGYLAVFRNSFDVAYGLPAVMEMTEKEFGRLGKMVRRLAHDLSSLAS